MSLNTIWSSKRPNFTWESGNIVRKRKWCSVKFLLKLKPDLGIFQLGRLPKCILYNTMDFLLLQTERRASFWEPKALLRKFWWWSLGILRFPQNCVCWPNRRTQSAKFHNPITQQLQTNNTCWKLDKQRFSTYFQLCWPQFSSPSKFFTWSTFYWVTKTITQWICLTKESKSAKITRFMMSSYLQLVKLRRGRCWV